MRGFLETHRGRPPVAHVARFLETRRSRTPEPNIARHFGNPPESHPGAAMTFHAAVFCCPARRAAVRHRPETAFLSTGKIRNFSHVVFHRVWKSSVENEKWPRFSRFAGLFRPDGSLFSVENPICDRQPVRKNYGNPVTSGKKCGIIIENPAPRQAPPGGVIVLARCVGHGRPGRPAGSLRSGRPGRANGNLF